MLIFIILIVFMKLFFPLYKIAPTSKNAMLSGKHVVVQKYFNKDSLKEKDVLLISPIMWIFDQWVWLIPYNRDFYKKYQEHVIWKVIFKF